MGLWGNVVVGFDWLMGVWVLRVSVEDVFGLVACFVLVFAVSCVLFFLVYWGVRVDWLTHVVNAVFSGGWAGAFGLFGELKRVVFEVVFGSQADLVVFAMLGLVVVLLCVYLKVSYLDW